MGVPARSMRELLLNLVILASLIVTTASLAVYVSGPETKIMPETRTAALFSGSELTIPVLHAREWAILRSRQQDP